MEALTGLAHVDSTILHTHYIHVSNKNSYVLEWLGLLGIDSSRVISGSILAKVLLLPEMGRCGAPSQLQLEWLRHTLLPITASHFLHIEDASKRSGYILLVLREETRPFKNISHVFQAVNSVATAHRIPVVIHNASNLPSIAEQINMFHGAIAVVTTHGAAEVFITFLNVSQTITPCVIEYNKIISSNLVYARMALSLGLNYRMNLWGNLSVLELSEQLQECLS